MPTRLSHDHPSVLIRRSAYEAAGIARAVLDERLGLTDEEFRVDGALVIVGPLVEPGVVPELVAALEDAGLTYFEDFVELSGNWPPWLSLIVAEAPRTA